METHWLDQIYQSLDPIAISIGPFAVRWYGLAYLAGFMLTAITIYVNAKRWKLDISPDDISDVMIGIMFGVILGARIGYVVFYGAGYYLEHPLSIFALHEGGMSFHGGLIGAILGGTIASKLRSLSVLTIYDLAVCGAPIGLFFGRVANFINGELWGSETQLPWGVIFESGGPVYRHPSQLYEALLEGIMLFIILFVLSKKIPARPQGTFIGTFLLVYGVVRFLVEFVRVPDAQLGYLFGFITMGQLLSLPLIIGGILCLVFATKAQKPQQGRL